MFKNYFFQCDGYYKLYNDKGSLKVETNYISGKHNGLWKSYDEEGNIQWEIEYKDDKRNGFYKKYYNTGILQVKREVINDQIEGKEIRYSKKGKVGEEGNYRNGKLVGEWKHYDENGRYVGTSIYKNNKLKKGALSLLLRPTEIPVWTREETAIYKGCEGLSELEKKECFSKKIDKLIDKNFDTYMAKELGLHGVQRIYATFQVDGEGKVYNIRAKARHPRLQEETIRIMEKIPDLTPAKQHGEVVGMTFTKSIVFRVD